MAAETGMTENPYGIEALWTTSDYVGKGVFVILIVMSLWSWLVMINKWLDQRVLKKVATEAEKNFWSAGSVQDGIGKLKGKVNPFRDIAQDGLQAIEHHRKTAARDVTSAIDVADYVQSHIDRRTSMLQSSLQSGMVVLASVGATSPFVGLFGTVLGIIQAFQSIGREGTASIAAVAPGVAEALVATAAGLFAAIPAVIAYNYFLTLVRRHATQLDMFRQDLLSLVESRVPSTSSLQGSSSRS